MTKPAQTSLDQDLQTALEAELAELHRANDAATRWGAAVGARAERIGAIDRQLAEMARGEAAPPRPDHAGGVERPHLSDLRGLFAEAYAADEAAQAPDKAAEREGVDKKRLIDAIDSAIDSLRFYHADGIADALDVAADNYLNAALTPKLTGTEAGRGVGAEGLRQAVAAYFAAFDAEPEKDCWDTETGEEEPGAQKFSSDWAHNDHMDAILAAREALRQALAATPPTPDSTGPGDGRCGYTECAALGRTVCEDCRDLPPVPADREGRR